MDLLNLFKNYLFSQADKPSKVTVKNYLSDINHFVRWYENTFTKSFDAKEVSAQTLEDYRNNCSTVFSPSSLDRHFSTLRKFFKFLLIEGVISLDPFSVKKLNLEANKDPWHVKEFKDFLYVGDASRLTIKNYLIDIKQFLAWAAQVTESANVLSAIDTNLVEEYKQRLMNQGDFSPATINRKLSSLRKYLAWGINKGIIESLELKIQNTELPVTKQQSSHTAVQQLIAPEPVIPNQQPAIKSYSPFPPLRLAQKISKGFILALDNGLIIHLAKIVDSAEYTLWKTQGQPVFTKIKTQNSKLKNLASNFKTNRAVNIQHSILSVKNIKKEFYAPLEISTKLFPWYKKAWFTARYSRPKWYKTYHSYPIVHYLNFAVLIIFLGVISFSFYNVFFQKGNQSPTLAVGTPVAPPRVLSFQGRLTDNNDNPITTPTNLRFGIYSSLSATDSASTAIFPWQEVDSVTPDQDGIFNVILGNNSTIPSTLFSQNAALWLGITVGTTPELTPRQQLATVAYATNAETLQGLVPTTSGPTAYTNTVLALDGTAGSPTLTIGGAVGTTFQATGGQFQILGKSLLLGSTSGSGGNVQITPDGLGFIDLQRPLINSTNTSNLSGDGNLGAVEIDDMLAVLATTSGAGITVNQNGLGDLLTASASGTTKFRLTNAGQIVAPYYNTANCTLKADTNGNVTCGLGSQFWQDVQGALFPSQLGDDVLLGSQSTTSATFAFTGLMTNNISGVGGHQTQASLSGQLIVTPNNGYGGGIQLGSTINSNNALNTLAAVGAPSGNLYWGNRQIVDSTSIGSFGVTSVTNSDGTLNISPTTGAAIASLNLTHANSWTGAQTFTTDTNLPNGIWSAIGRAGIGTTDIGNAELVVNQPNSAGDIFSASVSGTTKFIIDNTGALTSTAYTNAGGLLYTSTSGLIGQTTVGTAGQCLIGGATPTWSSCSSAAGGSFWQDLSGAISPLTNSDDLLIGSQSTTSATFAFTGLMTNNISGVGGHQTQASMSGNLVVMANNGYGGRVGIGTTAPTAILNVAGAGASTDFRISRTSDATKYISIAAPIGNVQTSIFGVNGTSALGLQTNGGVGIGGTYSQASGETYAYPANGLVVQGSVGIGTHSLLATLDVRGNMTQTPAASFSGNLTVAALVANNDGTGDLFTASASGATKFTIGNSGTITSATYTNVGGLLYTSASGLIGQTAAGSSSSLCLVGGTIPSWSSCSAASSNYWNLTNGNGVSNGGYITPINSTADLLIGGQSTASAAFAVLGLASPLHQTTASVSGNFVVMPNNGYGGNVGIGTTNPGANLDISNATTGTAIKLDNQIDTNGIGLSINNANNLNGIGISVGASSNITGTGIIIGSLSSGLGSIATGKGLVIGTASMLSGAGIQIGGDWNNANSSNTGNLLLINPTKEFTSGSFLTESANYINASRGYAVNNAGTTLRITGDLVSLSSNCTVTSGVCADTSHILALTQSLASASGSVFFVNNAGLGMGVDIESNSGGQVAMLVNKTGVGDIFTASASGTTKFTINNNGNLAATGALTGLTGLTMTSGPITLNSTTGTGLCLTGGPTASWDNCGGLATNYWNLVNGNGVSNGGYITPSNATADLLIGGQSTSSATFAVLGLATNSIIGPVGAHQTTASVSGNFVVMPNNGYGGNASISGSITLGIYGTGAIQTTNNQLLAIGGNTTGDIKFMPGNSSASLYLASSGYVGIGTTTPGYKLEIAGSSMLIHSTSNTSINITKDGWDTGSVAETTNGLELSTAYNNILFNAGGGERMRITNTGSVGIGTATPLASLDVRGNSGTSAIASFSGSTTFAGLVVDNSGVGDLITASSSAHGGNNPGRTEFVVTNGGDEYARRWLDLDNSSYFMDLNNTDTSLTTAGKVGIGNTSPGTMLDVRGSLGSSTIASISGNLIVMPNGGWGGNVGIGTTNPGAKLTINGPYDTLSLTHNASAIAQFGSDAVIQLAMTVQSTSPYTFSLQTRHSSVDGLSYPLALNPLGGNVGIGTTTPGQKLEVSGGGIHVVGAPTNPAAGSGQGLEIAGGATPWIQAYDRNASTYLPLSITGSTVTLAPTGWAYITNNVGAAGTPNPSASNNYALMFGWNPSGGGGESQILYGSGLGSTPRLDFGRWDGSTKTVDMTLKGGNVGIGTISPQSTLHVSNNGAPASSGNMNTGVIVSNGAPGYGLNLGVYDTGTTTTSYGWISTGYTNNAGSFPKLALNPNGGSVGIGTISPLELLDVSNPTTDAVIRLTYGGAPTLYFSRIYEHPNGGGSANLGYLGFDVHNWPGSTVTPMVLTGAGNVGVGTTSPATTLSNESSVSGDGIKNVSGGALTWSVNQSDAYAAVFDNAHVYGSGVLIRAGGDKYSGRVILNVANPDNTSRFIVKGDGTTGIGTASPDNTLSVNGTADKASGGTTWGTFSDIRLKNIDGNYTSGLAQIMQLQPVMFHYKPGNPLNLPSDEQNYGFVAQDVQKVMPEAVVESSNGYLQLSADPILWSMVNAIKEQQGEIASLSASLDSIGSRMTIDNSGNVGIGIAAPGAKLDVLGNGTGHIMMGDATYANYAGISLNGSLAAGNYNFLSGSGLQLYINRPTGQNIQFRENNVDQMTILTGGNVGIGTTGPNSKLSISGGNMNFIDANTTANANNQIRFGGIATDGTVPFIGTNNKDNANRLTLSSPTTSDGVFIGSYNWNTNLHSNVPNVWLFGNNISANGSTTVNGSIDVNQGNSGNFLTMTNTSSGDEYLNIRPNISGTNNGTAQINVPYNFAINFGLSGGARQLDINNNGSTRMDIGSSGYVTFYNGHNDLAENYLLTGSAKRATIIGFDPQNKIHVTLANNSQSIMGIVSTNPGAVMDANGQFKIGADTKESYTDEKVPVAAVGSVPVIVTGEPSSISNGDAITLSTIPGIGAKATTAGRIVGNALESNNHWNAQSCPVVNSLDSITWPEDDSNNSLKPCFILQDGTYVGKIMIFLSIGWHDPQVQLTSTGDLNLVDQNASDTNFTIPHYFTLNDALGNPISRVGAFSEVAVANLRAGFISAQQISTNSLSVATENVTIGGQSLKSYIASIVTSTLTTLRLQGLALEAQGIISPIASIDELHTNFISPVGNDTQIGLKLDNNKLSVLNTNSASGSAVAVIDNQGNASFSGQLTSNSLNTNDATISGTLHAGRILADDIVGLHIQAATVSAQYITNVTNIYNSTPSGQTASVSGNFGLIANAATPNTNNQIPNSGNYIDISSYSGSLAYVDNLSAANAAFSQNLIVFGQTSLSDTSIVGQLSVGGNLILANDSINVLGSDLNLQPLRQGGLSIMGGLFYIDTDGNVKVGGNADFAKNVTVHGTLATNIISPLPGSDLSLNTGNSNLKVTNASNAAVLSVNPLGDLVASGAATFSKLNLGLIQPAFAVSPTEVIATGSAGVVTLKANQANVTVQNPLVTEHSLIYVTPAGQTAGQNLFLQQQVPNDPLSGTQGSFTVGAGAAQPTDTKFNFLIIN